MTQQRRVKMNEALMGTLATSGSDENTIDQRDLDHIEVIPREHERNGMSPPRKSLDDSDVFSIWGVKFHVSSAIKLIETIGKLGMPWAFFLIMLGYSGLIMWRYADPAFNEWVENSKSIRKEREKTWEVMNNFTDVMSKFSERLDKLEKR